MDVIWRAQNKGLQAVFCCGWQKYVNLVGCARPSLHFCARRVPSTEALLQLFLSVFSSFVFRLALLVCWLITLAGFTLDGGFPQPLQTAAFFCFNPQKRCNAIYRYTRCDTPPPPPPLLNGVREASSLCLPSSNLDFRPLRSPPPLTSEPMEQRYLRWHGWLVRYGIGGSQDPSSPAVLLVHGFGASCDQWDQVFHNFAPFSTVGTPGGAVGGSGEEVVGEGSGGSGGVRLMALDLLGFGHSAKPPLSFSQYSWADCARDVALRAGGGAFYIAGNSIGG